MRGMRIQLCSDKLARIVLHPHDKILRVDDIFNLRNAGLGTNRSGSVDVRSRNPAVRKPKAFGPNKVDDDCP